MSLRRNDALRDSLATHQGGLFDGGTVELRTGGQPADPDSAASGTLLSTIALPTPALSVAGPVISKAGSWSGDAVATATAGWARIKNAAGTRWIDVSVTEGGGGGDLTIDDDAVVSGGIVTVTGFSITIPDGV